MKCTNRNCKYGHWSPDALAPCEKCRREHVAYVINSIADRARLERLRNWEQHKHNKKHQKKDDE